MRSPARLLLVLVMALVGSLAVSAPASAANSTVSGTVSIAGDATTPVNGTVWFQPPGAGSYGGISFSGGAFSTSGFANGDYLIRVQLATMDGYSRWYVQGQPAGTTVQADATVVHLDGSPLDLGEMVVPQIATAQGTVKDGNGDPVPGVVVVRNRGGSVTNAPPTDLSGHYQFGYVLAGSTTFSVNGNGTVAGDQVTVTVPTSGHLDVDLTMPLAAHIAGTLSEAGSGNAIPYLEVWAFGVGGGASGYTYVYTDVNGHYDIGGLHFGDYVLRYNDYDKGFPQSYNGGGSDQGTAPHLVTVAGATLTHNESLVPRPDPKLDPYTLAGTVREDTTATGDPSRGLAGIEVTATSGTDVYTTTTDRDGRWAIDAVPGDYAIRAANSFWLDLHEDYGVPWFPEYYPNAWDATAATPVSAATSLGGLDMDLTRAARLRTTVTGPGGTTDLTAGYRVYAPDGTVMSDRAPVPFDGNNMTVLLRPGSWKVLVTGWTPAATMATPLLPQWYGGGASRSAAPTVTAVAGDDIGGFGTTLPGKLQATKPPHITGKPKVGKKLKVTKGSWNLMTDTTFDFTWLRGSKVVGHAASYTVKPPDAGKKLTVKVLAANGDLSTTVKATVKVR
jgi:hypothetical protein